METYFPVSWTANRINKTLFSVVGTSSEKVGYLIYRSLHANSDKRLKKSLQVLPVRETH